MMNLLKKKLEISDLGKRWGNIPWHDFDKWHLESLIEEMGFVREDIGTFIRIAEDEKYSQEIRQRARNNIDLYTAYLHRLKMRIESERFRQRGSV